MSGMMAVTRVLHDARLVARPICIDFGPPEMAGHPVLHGKPY